MIGELAPHPNSFVQPGTYVGNPDTAMTDGIPHAMLNAQREQTHPLASPEKVRSHLRQHHGVRPGSNPVTQHAEAHVSQLLDQGHNYDSGEITHDSDPGSSDFANVPRRTLSLVRHVRTERGSTFFKKPIGSVITEAEYQAIKAEREGQRVTAKHMVYGSHPVTITKVHQSGSFIGTIHHPQQGDISGVAFRPEDISSYSASISGDVRTAKELPGSAESHAELLKARAEARKAYPAGHPERLKAERAVRQSRKTDEYRSSRSGTEETSTPKATTAAKKDPGFFSPAGRDEIGSGKGASPEQLRTEREANERNSLSPGKRAIYDVARKRRGESHADAMKRANSTSPPKLQEPHPDDETHDDFQPKKRERTMSPAQQEKAKRLLGAEFKSGEGEALTGQKVSPREQITGLTPDQQRRYYAQRNAGISHERALQNAARTPETGHTARKQEYQRLVAENEAQNHYLGGSRSLARSEFENLTPGSHEVISGHLARAHASEKAGKHSEAGDHLAKAIDVAEQTNTRRTREMRRVLEERLHRANSAKRETERQEVRTGGEAEASAKKRDEQIAKLNAMWAASRKRARDARGPTAAQSATKSANEFERQLKELGATFSKGIGWRHPDRRK